MPKKLPGQERPDYHTPQLVEEACQQWARSLGVRLTARDLGAALQLAELAQSEGQGNARAVALGLLQLLDFPAPLLEAAALSMQKARDYNSSVVSRDDYFPFGAVSYAQMLNVKALRLVSITSGTRAPRFESLRDTALDMINYATFLVEWLDRQDRGGAEEEVRP